VPYIIPRKIWEPKPAKAIREMMNRRYLLIRGLFMMVFQVFQPQLQPPPEQQLPPPSWPWLLGPPSTGAAKVDISFSVPAWHLGHLGLGAPQVLVRFSNWWPHLAQRYS